MDFLSFNRIVIKVGSSLLSNKNGQINQPWLKSLADDVTELRKKGVEVIIVTSGGVALGRGYINRPTGELRLEEKQAAVACGQLELMQGYKNAFAPDNIAQILITIQDTERRRNYLNVRNALETLIKNHVIPIINENDVVATAELNYGDNDRLSARVAQMLDADLLVIFSDVDGLYTKNPMKHEDSEHVPEVHKISKAVENMAGKPTSNVGTGGMQTKIEAAKIATAAGCHCVITQGAGENPLHALYNGKLKYTKFISQTTPLTARKQWIVSGVKPMGEIIVDKGAAEALKNGSSLLPAGATAVSGKFERGDLVIIKSPEGEIARGLSSHSAENTKLILGKKSSETPAILGYSGRDELIHRDNMVITS
ncbi:MAG: glutamate 5-kinase [Alphaproteobacteria bacterium CG11_big_fil_rev_8_21_14_0_20_44_7]|nr:MAG: glutamate 5-kinase [Alphaproteobacteria bacterium CG11_big_fil_rev_8_21_14_0_20_44_7]